MDVSVIICTRNRASALRQTLDGFERIHVPPNWKAEVLIVDNGSTNETEAVVHSLRFSHMKPHYVHESKSGLSNARNAGLSLAQGEIILFTDDDVIPAIDWLERLATPLLEQQCDAIVGRVELAEHLQRAWMRPVHKLWLAAPLMADKQQLELIGASMGFRRCVFERVPAFDPELGPGALGFGEESLFSRQLIEAGYRLGQAPDAVAIHHFEPSRLLRSQWLTAAKQRGAATAYRLHHWDHCELKYPRVRSFHYAAKLILRRILQPPVPMDAEGCAPWELDYVYHLEMRRQFLKERFRTRNYRKCGLARLDAGKPSNVGHAQHARLDSTVETQVSS